MSAAERRLFPNINMGMCFCLLYPINIFKMAAELYKCVYTIVAVPRMARFYTILSAARQTHIHTVYIELDGGRQAGRQAGREGAGKERGRMDGVREGARGGWEGTR